MALMEIRHLTFTYPGADVPALHEVSLEIAEGSFIVLCGTTGSGKSTLLRHLKPELSPYGRRTGTLLYRDAALESLQPRESAASVGFVMQDPDSQIVTDTVWHELAFGLENLGTDSGVIRRRVAEMASFFGIEAWFRRSCATLSSGQKQILALASVMAMQPRMLVLDEPTAQLDPIAAGEFLQLLERIHRELGTTVVIAEHRLEETLPIADRAIVMDAGEIVYTGAPARIGPALMASPAGQAGALRCMISGLPAASRIAMAAGCTGDLPLTPREGHAWLAQISLAKFGLKQVALAQPLQVEPQQVAITQPAPDPIEQPQLSQPTPNLSTPILEAREIWFRYNREDPDILRGLSIAVRHGEIHAVLGGNGTGKTTLLSLLRGLIRPQRGHVFMGGRNFSARGGHAGEEGVVLLGSDPRALFVHETVGEELADLRATGARNTDAVVELFGIRPFLARHPMDLSSGERQKVALAMALLRDPRVLLLDEPTRGLDPASRETLQGILRGLADLGRGILLVTHDVEFAAMASGTCSLLFDGEIVSSGPPAAFFAGNRFYTTAANRIAREWFPDIVTVEDILTRWGLVP